MSVHVLIENTLVQHKMAKNSRMAMCCQNQAYKGTGQCYGLHSSVSISGHSTHVKGARLTEEEKGEDDKEEERIITNGLFNFFRLAT